MIIPNKRTLVILSLAFLAFLFASSYAFSEGNPGIPKTAKEETVSKISIGHGYTRGFPPVYDLTLFSDGLVVYHGIKNVSIIGYARKHIEPQKFREFAQEFERINFFTLRDGTLCPLAMDLPMTTVSVTRYGEEKMVRYNWSCDANAELIPLVKKIEEKVFAGEWEK